MKIVKFGGESFSRSVVNGSLSGCVWSINYGPKIVRYRVVILWPGPDDYGPWVRTI